MNMPQHAYFVVWRPLNFNSDSWLWMVQSSVMKCNNKCRPFLAAGSAAMRLGSICINRHWSNMQHARAATSSLLFPLSFSLLNTLLCILCSNIFCMVKSSEAQYYVVLGGRCPGILNSWYAQRPTSLLFFCWLTGAIQALHSQQD